MVLTVKMTLIVAVGVFLASFMDAIAGGGGIISVPTYLLAGVPMHMALGTNKVSSGIGTAVSTARFIKNGYIDWKLGIPSVALALVGSFAGTSIQLMIDEVYLQYLLLIVLPVVAFVVLRQRQFPEERGEIDRRKQCAIVWLASFVVGAYDGFYGPGTGTFLLLIYCNLAKMDVRTAGGNVKLVNLSSNIGAFVTSLRSGQVFLVLGLIGAVTSIAGHYVGSGLAIKNGSKIVRPTVVIVLILLALFGKFFGNDRRVYCWTIGLTLLAALYDLLRTLPEGLRAGLHLDGALRAVGGVLPLSSQGLGWICPAALGLVIGLIAHFAGRRKAA